jgi:hypothetical protein
LPKKRMRKIISSLVFIIILCACVVVVAKPSSQEVAEAIKQAVPKGYAIENTISKTDEISINDIIIRYGLAKTGDSKPYYGYQCDLVSKSKDDTLTVEITSFYKEQDAAHALSFFSDGYAKYLSGLDQSLKQIKRSEEKTDSGTYKYLDYTMDEIQKRTTAFVKYNYLIVLSYPLGIQKDAEAFTTALYEKLQQASVADAKSTSRPYMETTFSPSCFSETTDTVEITVIVYYSENYTGKNPLDSFVLTDKKTGKTVKSLPFGTGQGVFTVSHNDKNATSYEYTVSCGDFTEDIVIPVLDAYVETEKNIINGIVYNGIAADGVETLKIRVVLSGMNKGVLDILQPETGKIISHGLFQRKKIKNPGEIMEFEYVPPKYVQGDLKKETFMGEELYYVTVPLRFTYTPDNGIPVELATEIKVYRPPVLFVSGKDLPDKEEQGLLDFLKEKRYTVFRHSESSADEALEIMNERLSSYLKDLKDRMTGSGIKITCFDTISFGFGGLITRSYIASPMYRNDIRKCILIAVPNHGLKESDIKNSPQWSGFGDVLKKQLTYDSDFLNKLNDGEAYGEHINAMVQYANLSSYSGKPGFMEGDGVIPLWSAYLNGTVNKTYWQLAHSRSFADHTPSLLYTEEVYNDILGYLSEDIAPGRLFHMKAILYKSEGEVSLTGKENTALLTEDDNPYPLSIADRVTTGEGRAVVHIYLDSVLVSEIFLDKHSEYVIGDYCEGIVYGSLEEGKAYIRNKSKKTRNILFFEGDAGTYKSSLQNSECLLETGKEPAVSCYAGTVFYALHELDMTGDLKSVSKGQKAIVESGLTTETDEEPFRKDSFFKKSMKDRFYPVKFYIVDTIKELARYVMETGNLSGMFKHNRRLLIPIALGLLLIAVTFILLTNRKIRFFLFVAAIVAAAIFIVMKIKG